MEEPKYVINIKGIEDIEDVKIVLEALGLSVTDANPKFQELREAGLIIPSNALSE